LPQESVNKARFVYQVNVIGLMKNASPVGGAFFASGAPLAMLAFSILARIENQACVYRGAFLS